MQVIQRNLIRLMGEKDITVYELSKLSKISYSSVYQIYAGKRKNPRTDTIIKLKKFFNVPYDEFYKE